MSYQVLARKWRPQSFKEMVGQEHVLRALINALDENRLHHAYLFTGTRGVGKTTVARNFAKALNCEQGISSTPCGQCRACVEISEGRFIDLIEVDAASRTKVEDTRELLDNILYAPTNGRFKIYLIDEVHMLSSHSFNALLKTLEEPPPHVKFLLATTDPQKLPVTILSRCLQFNLKPMPPALISGHLEFVLQQENIQFEAPAIREIAHAADGSMRDALSLLDQAIAYGHSEIKTAEVREMLGTVARDQVVNIARALAANDASAVVAAAQQLAQMSPDYDNALSELLALLYQVALLQQVPDALDTQVLDFESIKSLAESMPAEDVQLFYQIGLIGRRDLSHAPDRQSGFEMVLLRMLAFKPAAAGSVVPVTAPASAPVSQRPASSTPPAAVSEQARQALNSTEVATTTASVTAPAQPAMSRQNPPVDTAPAGPVAGLHSDWHEIVNALPLKGMTRQLALNCELKGYEDKFVVLAVSPDHKSMQTKTSEDQLAEALSKFFHKEVKVKFEAGDIQMTPAVVEQKIVEDRQQAARNAIENDAVVQGLKENFGATVIEQSIRPIEE